MIDPEQEQEIRVALLRRGASPELIARSMNLPLESVFRVKFTMETEDAAPKAPADDGTSYTFLQPSKKEQASSQLDTIKAFEDEISKDARAYGRSDVALDHIVQSRLSFLQRVSGQSQVPQKTVVRRMISEEEQQ